MTETRVLLLRHAETADPSRFHGAESDVALGERGHKQVAAAAAFLASLVPQAVYTSGMRRARETAEPIARSCGLEALVEPLLHERKMGNLSGLSREDGQAQYAEAKRRWMSGEAGYTHPGGESFAAIRDRVVPVFRAIVDRWAGKTVVIVAHGVVIRIILTTILPGQGAADFERYSIDNTAINDLRFDGRAWRAEALNQRVAAEWDGFSW